MASHTTEKREESVTDTASPLEPEDLDELARLRKDLLQMIHHHTQTAKKPPFTTPELLVIAAVCWDHDRPTPSTIHRDLLKNFAYYGRKAIDQYVDVRDLFHDDYVPKAEGVIPDFEESFNLYDLPLIDGDGEYPIVDRVLDHGPQNIEVVPRAARLFLSKWLVPEERKGTFPFLKLPAELRNAIYEMLFTLPKEGIAVVDEYQQAGLHVVRRRDDSFEPEDLQDYPFDGHDYPTLYLDALARNLHLLCVSKQIYEEAMPFFYNLNLFCCIELSGTLCFLQRGTERLKHVRDLRLDFGDMGRPRNDQLARLPALLDTFSGAAGHISRLEIQILDGDWIGMQRRYREVLGRKSTIKTCAQVPGFKALAKLCSKAETLNFVGECQQIEKWVREEVEKIRSQARALEVGGEKKRGRKAEADGSKGTMAHKKIKNA